MHRNISKIIVDCCEKEGIPYTSIYLKHPKVLDDVYKLRDIYLQLKEIEGTLEEIAERHELNGLDKLLRDDLEKLETTDHDILKLAQKLAKENK